MKKIQKKWFTLIEFMIVITIMMLVLLLSYAPYNLYQNKARVKLATREISQSFYEARNMAISWIQSAKNKSDETNKSVWILLEKSQTKNSKIKYFLFQKDIFISKNFESGEEFKQKDIQDWVFIKNFPWNESVEKILIVYEASSGQIKIFNYDTKNEILKNDFQLEVSYRNSSSEILNRTIKYYLKTNIVDYEKK